MLTKMNDRARSVCSRSPAVSPWPTVPRRRRGRDEILQKYDTNKDGKLDDTEKAAMNADFKAKRAERKAEMLAKFDTNKDGKLDESGARRDASDERATEAFKKLDANGDGQLSLDEFKAGRGKTRHASPRARSASIAAARQRHLEAAERVPCSRRCQLTAACRRSPSRSC